MKSYSPILNAWLVEKTEKLPSNHFMRPTERVPKSQLDSRTLAFFFGGSWIQCSGVLGSSSHKADDVGLSLKCRSWLLHSKFLKLRRQHGTCCISRPVNQTVPQHMKLQLPRVLWWCLWHFRLFGFLLHRLQASAFEIETVKACSC